MAEGLTPFSQLSRGLRGTRNLMIWERLMPCLGPFVVYAGLIAVIGQWGGFTRLSAPVHALIIFIGLAITIFASVRALKGFKTPSFSEINARLALDNGIKAERLLAMRHETKQPHLRIGKAKAGFAQSDPYALRYVAILGSILGFIALGPVPFSQILDAFMPFKLMAKTVLLAAK